MLGTFVGTALLVTAAASGYLASRPGPVKTARVANGSTTLEALDAHGEVVWSRTFAQPVPAARHKGEPPWLIVDMDGDGLNEVACFCPIESQNDADEPGAQGVVLFDQTGRELWSYRGGRPITFDDRSYADSYGTVLAGVGRGRSGSRYLVVIAQHRPYHPTQLSMLDRDGRLIGEYWNAGYVFDIVLADVDNDQVDEIVFGGVNNDLGLRPIVGIIEHDIQGGLSPGPTEFPDFLRQAEELAYIALPLTSLGRSRGIGSWVRSVHKSGELFSFEVHFADRSNLFERVYMFDANLDLVRVSFPTDFKQFLFEQQRLGAEVTLKEEMVAARQLDRYPSSVGPGKPARAR